MKGNKKSVDKKFILNNDNINKIYKDFIIDIKIPNSLSKKELELYKKKNGKDYKGVM